MIGGVDVECGVVMGWWGQCVSCKFCVFVLHVLIHCLSVDGLGLIDGMGVTAEMIVKRLECEVG